MAGDAALLGSLKNGAGFDLQVMGRFSSGEPMAVQVETPFWMLPNTLQCLILRCVFYDFSKQLTSASFAKKRPRSVVSRACTKNHFVPDHYASLNLTMGNPNR